jgi:hypothetical protein
MLVVAPQVMPFKDWQSCNCHHQSSTGFFLLRFGNGSFNFSVNFLDYEILKFYSLVSLELYNKVRSCFCGIGRMKCSVSIFSTCTELSAQLLLHRFCILIHQKYKVKDISLDNQLLHQTGAVLSESTSDWRFIFFGLDGHW